MAGLVGVLPRLGSGHTYCRSCSPGDLSARIVGTLTLTGVLLRIHYRTLLLQGYRVHT